MKSYFVILFRCVHELSCVGLENFFLSNALIQTIVVKFELVIELAKAQDQ